jgi:glycosyltransferase involved in cell wall biosynthesis
MLSYTGHNIYVARNEKDPIPFSDFLPNMINMGCEIGKYEEYFGVDFDVVISEHKNVMSRFIRIADIQKIPVIHVEHRLSTLSPYASKSYRSLNCHHVFYNEQQAKGYGFQDDCFIIPRGVDTNIFSRYLQWERKPQILVVTNGLHINPLKGLQALNGIRRLLSNIPINIVGQNTNISNFVFSHHQLLELYNTHSVFLNTCCEPQSYSVLEALACKIPVVSVPTVDGKIHQYVKVGETPQEIASHISNILSNPVDEEFLNEGRKFVETFHSIKQFTKKWEEVLDEVICREK